MRSWYLWAKSFMASPGDARLWSTLYQRATARTQPFDCGRRPCQVVQARFAVGRRCDGVPAPPVKAMSGVFVLDGDRPGAVGPIRMRVFGIGSARIESTVTSNRSQSMSTLGPFGDVV